jgi:hypothetical protein
MLYYHWVRTGYLEGPKKPGWAGMGHSSFWFVLRMLIYWEEHKYK